MRDTNQRKPLGSNQTVETTASLESQGDEQPTPYSLEQIQIERIIDELTNDALPNIFPTRQKSLSEHRYDNFQNLQALRTPVSLDSYLNVSPENGIASTRNVRSVSISGDELSNTSSATEISHLASETETVLATARRLSNGRSPTSVTQTSPIARYIPSSLLQYENVCDVYDIDKNMRTMDRLYDASFYQFIKNDENVLVIARHAVSIARDYEIKIVANALRWLIDGWSLENVAKLLKLTTRDWTPNASGILIHLLTQGWDIKVVPPPGLSQPLPPSSAKSSRISYKSSFDTTAVTKETRHAILKLAAIIVAGETAASSAEFIHTLTFSDSWTSERVTEMVSFLDAVLEWDETYFQQFTQHYVEFSFSSENPSRTSSIDIEQQKHQLQDKQPLIDQDSDRDETETSEESINDKSEEKNSPVKHSEEAKGKRKSHLRDGGKIKSKISFDYLAALYKTNLALANYRLALADFKLALASRSIQTATTADTEEPQQSSSSSTKPSGANVDGSIISENPLSSRKSSTASFHAS